MDNRIVWISMLAAASLLSAQDKPAPDLRTKKTQTIEFTAGGLIRMKGSTGSLTIEAWDKPTVELTTIKSAKSMPNAKDREKASAELDQVAFTAERHGDELEIKTAIPKHAGDIDLSYHLWVPRDTRLAIDHGTGEINVEGVAGDIAASLRHGEIFVYLPDGATYNTKAQSKVGSVNLPGDPAGKRTHFGVGHTVAQETGGKVHSLDLKVGYGDIYVLKASTRSGN
jgi:hypothetical protein